MFYIAPLTIQNFSEVIFLSVQANTSVQHMKIKCLLMNSNYKFSLHGTPSCVKIESQKMPNLNTNHSFSKVLFVIPQHRTYRLEIILHSQYDYMQGQSKQEYLLNLTQTFSKFDCNMFEIHFHILNNVYSNFLTFVGFRSTQTL